MGKINLTTFILVIKVIYLVSLLNGVYSTKEEAVLKSNKVTKIGENWYPNYSHDQSKRHLDHRISKRWIWPSESDKQYILDLHNNFRRLEGASNMEYMTWNNVLSDMAGAWGDMCIWAHGQPDGYNPPYSSLGQNLFITNNYNLENKEVIKQGMEGFYTAEKPFWTFETSDCVPGQQCGHYTQVVWAESREVGCAISRCEQVPKNLPEHFAFSLYLVCNYGPAGNLALSTGKLRQPYKIGPACTECTSGNFWCDNGLCRSKESCRNGGANCDCKAACKNCATLDINSCTCSCAKGFTGVDCSADCVDTHMYCGANPGWPAYWCNEPERAYVKANCPKLCNVCEPLTPGETSTCSTTSPATTSTATTTRPVSTTTSTATTRTTVTTTTTTTKPTTTTITKTSQPSSTPSTSKTTSMSSSSASPTPTTTTTTNTTTVKPTSTTTEVDCTNLCKNGGTVILSRNSNQCTCTCKTGWQGPTCEEKVEEARVGMTLTISANRKIWYAVWDFYLLPVLVRSINTWCNSNVPSCCPEATVQKTKMTVPFSTENEIIIGEGYPKEYSIRENVWITEALMYAYGSKNNELCSSTKSDNAIFRRKRALPELTLSQDTLQQILDSVTQNITSLLKECCNVTLISIKRAETDDQEVPDKEKTGLDLWVWIVIAIGVGLVIFITLTIAIYCYCIKKNKTKREKYTSPESGYDNRAYMNHENKY